jgi:phospholipid/cholesterol/gamma-HCH transport system substrate-binding protein
MAKLSSNITKGIVGVVVLALIGGVLYFVLSGSDMKKVSADFDEAIGVYPGTPVKILGVNVGDVTSVTPKGDKVHVGMEYDSKYKLPKDVHAVLVANSLVSDRYIELADGTGNAYSGFGPSAPNNYSIPKNQTTSPAELDDIYKALSDLTEALGPNGVNKNGALSDLLDVAAANLKGNGKLIGQSITKLSAATQTLSNNRGNLFETVKNLKLFTKTLQDSDGVLRHFEEQLAQVASDLASERSDFGAALHQLGLALDAVARFVRTNASKVHVDLVGLRKVTAILIAEKASLNETLAVGPVALANIVHAYQPTQGVIATRGNLDSFTDPGQICQALKTIGGALGLGNIPVLGGLLGPLLDKVVAKCSAILKTKLPGTNSSSHTQLSGSQLVTIVHSAVAGMQNNDVGGVITGGGE